MKQFNIRLGSWQSLSLVIAALIVAAVFLWIGLALAVVLAVLASAALAIARIRSFWTRKPGPRVPTVIEGQYTEVKQ